MKKLTLAEAKADAERQALWVWRQENWGQGPHDGWGASIVGDHDEDYLVDELFDIPNR